MKKAYIIVAIIVCVLFAGILSYSVLQQKKMKNITQLFTMYYEERRPQLTQQLNEYRKLFGDKKTNDLLAECFQDKDWILSKEDFPAIMEYSVNILNSCDSNSVYFTGLVSTVTTIDYLQGVLGERKDVSVIVRDCLFHESYLDYLSKNPILD